MYLRHSTRRKNGKTHVYWRLVRSVRRGGKVVQETVAQLASWMRRAEAAARDLALTMTGRRLGNVELFEDPAPSSRRVAVRLDQVRVERGRSFGDVWMGYTLWRALRLDELCAGLLPRGRETTPWAAIVELLVIGRLCEPSSRFPADAQGAANCCDQPLGSSNKRGHPAAPRNIQPGRHNIIAHQIAFDQANVPHNAPAELLGGKSRKFVDRSIATTSP